MVSRKEKIKIKNNLIENNEFNNEKYIFNVTHLIWYMTRKSKLEKYNNELYQEHTINIDDEVVNFVNKNNISNLSNVANYILEEEKEEFFNFLKKRKCCSIIPLE